MHLARQIMANIISETFYGNREPQWLVESSKEEQSHFDRRGCVRQIRTSGYRSNSRMHTPARNYENLPTRSSYPLEQPSVATADRQAYVYHAAPATHRTVDRPALNTLNVTSANIPIVEFMVPLCCGKCEEKVKEELEHVEGVYKVVCDQHNQKVTVSSNLDPQRLLKRVKRVKKNSHFWSGSTYLRNVHHNPTFSSGQSHHSLVHRSDIPAYKQESAHHRSTSRMSGQNQRYLSPRSSYDGVETHYLKRKSVGAQAEGPELYYAGAEHQYKSSGHGATPFRTSLDAQVYTTGAPFFPAPISSSLHYGHLPSSYGPTYEFEDYGMSSTGYY